MVEVTDYISTKLQRIDYISMVSTYFISARYYRQGKMHVITVGENNF